MQAAHNLVEQSQPSHPHPDPQRPIPGWVTALYAAVDAFDMDTFLSFLSPECELHFANAPAIYGHEAIRQAIGGLFAAIKGISHQNLEAWVNPDATICSGYVTYTRKNDTTLTVPFAVIFRLDHDLVRKYQIFVDNSQLFA
jgi:ketosteroid isomerase-like protein